MAYYLGADLGSSYVKILLMTGEGAVVERAVEPTEVVTRTQSERLVNNVVSAAGLTRRMICRVAASGWGRDNLVDADDRITDIAAVARGAVGVMPGVSGVLDVGGQDTKAIRIGKGGRVLRFALNDKCAAGTGRFLEMATRKLGVSPEEFARIAARSAHQIAISSFCTVFAESEIVGLVAQGTSPEDIARAVEVSTVDRIIQMAGGMLTGGVVLFTGGLALNADLAGVLQDRVEAKIVVPEHPQFVGALGAALIAHDRDGRDEGGRGDV